MIPAVRHTDPSTSYAAALRAPEFAGGHRERILAAANRLTRLGRVITADTIATASGLTVVQTDRRLIELQRAGLMRVMKHADGADHVFQGFRCWSLA